ncbi:MAG: selenium cofactor biosynthesis protein YqeC [Chloroflexi bacterium]|nr:selenium cofactor biosynthesis protein YqeC [Chloroflexota bacterium]
MMGQLLAQLAVQPGDCVAVVGAGGKTTLCWRLVQELAQCGARAVFTTTTKIRQPSPGVFDRLVVAQGIEQVMGLGCLGLPDQWRTACVAASVEGAPDDRPVAESYMPAAHTKLSGFTGQQICELRDAISNTQSPISLIVEADGARGLLLKAPAENEPVIPACTTLVCVVASLEALGRPLDERTAHRPERIAALTGAQMGQPITAQLLASLLAHPLGGLKGIPPDARKVAVLMQRAETTPHPAAAGVAHALVERGFDQAIVISPRAEDALSLISTDGS